jgi:hypothetical protein
MQTAKIIKPIAKDAGINNKPILKLLLSIFSKESMNLNSPAAIKNQKIPSARYMLFLKQNEVIFRKYYMITVSFCNDWNHYKNN